MRFSQKIGKTALKKDIQLEGIDNELKNKLWNIIKLRYLDLIPKTALFEDTDFKKFAIKTWHNIFKLPVDELPDTELQIEQAIRDFFFSSEWFLIYDFIEYLIELDKDKIDSDIFIEALNESLESEFSGYRIISNNVAPISNRLEFDEVSDSLISTNSYSCLTGANRHLQKAIDLLSDKKKPDYRNSIKESISAVESTCRIITSENTLGKALNKLESKGLYINEQLKEGFDKIYAYTNNKENGIRHAIVDSPREPDFDEAKYMLISCSTFINYLIGKSNKIGILSS